MGLSLRSVLLLLLQEEDREDIDHDLKGHFEEDRLCGEEAVVEAAIIETIDSHQHHQTMISSTTSCPRIPSAVDEKHADVLEWLIWHEKKA